MKVHVTLKREIRKDHDAKVTALGEVLAQGGMTDYNRKRFERYGIITGEVDSDRIPQIQQLQQVQSVQPEGRKYAL